jgi:hypothetical protein
MKMGQFKGSNIRVRCVDCVKLDGTRCSAKDTSVAPKKRRVCSTYVFKGEYENRTPAEGIYMPPMDKKTRKMIEKLIRMGVVPVADDGTVETRGGFARTKTLPMPASTATASLLGVKPQEDPALYQDIELPEEETRIWGPDQGNEQP